MLSHNVITLYAVFNILSYGSAALGLLFFLILNFVEFGFFDTQFTGMERGETYFLPFGTISGPIQELLIGRISLTLLTAGKII